MTQQMAVWGEPGSSALAKREDLFAYSLAVEWEGDHPFPWRQSKVVLPSGRGVHLDQYVAENFKRPRMFHPEYAMAIELLILNAITEAKARGFDIVACELGYWAYKTITTMGRRVAKIGLAEPITREDGRTKTYKAHQWVSPEGQAILLLPWAAGDQQIRFKDERGVYVVPINEATADAAKCQQRLSWKGVKDYPQLPYETKHPWETVPLLEEGDDMTLLIDCEGFCKVLFPMQGTMWRSDATWTYVHPTAGSMVLAGTRKRWCRTCHDELKRLRLNAANQGWNYDAREPLRLPKEFTLGSPKGCEHVWGRQMSGSQNIILPSGEIEHNMVIRWECLKCATPTPAEHMSPEDKEAQTAQEMRQYKKRKRS